MDLGFDPKVAVMESLGGTPPEDPAARPNLQASMALAVGTIPEAQAALRRVAKATGVPVDVVAAHHEELKRKATLSQFDFATYEKMFPASAAVLSNIDLAKIAHDDTDNMGAVEKVTTSFSRGLKNSLRGGDASAITESVEILGVIDRIESGELNDDVKLAQSTRYGSMFAGVQRTPERLQAARALHEQRIAENAIEFARRTKEVRDLPVSRDYQKFSEAQGLGDAASALGDAPISITSQVLSESTGALLPSLPLIVGGGAAGGVRGLAAATGLTSSGTEYSTALAGIFDELGVDMADEKAVRAAMATSAFKEKNRQALIKAGVIGAFDAATAGVAGTRLVKSAVGNVAAQTGVQATGGAAGEVAGSVASGQEVSASAVIAEAIGEVPGSLVDVGVITARNRKGNQKARAAEQNAKAVEELGQLAAESKLRERDPEAFRQLVEKAAENGTVKDIYINPQDLAQAGVDVIGLAGISPSVQEQLQQALDTGGDIKIPFGEYATNIAPSEFNRALTEHIKTEPEGMSLIEAQEFSKNQAAELQAQTEKVLAEKIDNEAFAASRKTVHEEILRQLNEANRFSPDVNESYATLHSNFATVYGAKLGMTPEEFYKKYYPQENKFVQAQGMTGGATLDLQQITREQALAAKVPLDLPKDEAFTSAVANTAGAQVTDEGLVINLVRFQKPEQEGEQAIRTGVFYLPAGSKDVKHYRTGKNGYGGVEKFEGETLIRRPLFVKGATGGKVPELAYDALKGKGAYKRMRSDVLATVLKFGRRASEEDVGSVLEKYGAGADLAYEILRVSREGNTLPYALQENIVAHAVRGAGYDAVVGYSKGKAGPFISEVFDVREQTYPARGMDSQVHDAYYQDGRMKTDTPEFKNWFGDSKVVDEKGAPLVVYHATDAQFDTFDFERLGQFTRGNTDAPQASVMAEVGVWAHGRPLSKRTVQERDMPMYLALQNPLRLSFDELWNLSSDYLDGETLRETLKKEGYDGLEVDDSEFGGVSYVAFGPEQIKSVFNRGTFDPNDPNILNQDTGNKRGSFNPATSTITLLAKADLSTFLHESGHFFLETLNRIALDPNAPAEVKQDMDATLKWMGIEADGEPAGGTKEGEFNQDGQRKTDTPEFKNWFGDSKVVDAEGKPLVVYHGTRREFDAFEPMAPRGAAGNPAGIYFTADRSVASEYAEDDDGATDEKSRVVAAYLSIQSDADGIVKHSTYRGTEYIVFDPTKIKSVYNRGAFDPNDPNILNQGGEDGTQQPLPSGRTRLEVWNAMSLEEQRVYHEKFARGFEAYLFEGRAPSLEIQRVFQRFRAWLMKVYRSLVALNVEINDDVRGVFDRMLASSEQIKEAEAARNFEPMFRTPEEAGMTPEEFKDYIDTGLQASMDAAHELEKRSLRDMKWLSNAKGKALKKLQAEADAKRRAVRQEITEQVMSEPVYRAREFLKRGMLDGDKVEGAHKLYIPEVEAMLEGNPALGAIKEKLGYGKYGMLGTEQGVHPDQVAEMFGLESGDQLIRELVAAEDPKAKIDALTDKTMLERYGDLTDEDAVERAAERAIHNEARLRFVATEMAALLKQMGSVQELQRLAKGAAESAIGQVKVKELNPNRYIAAGVRASRAAEKAIKSGDRNEAIRQKRLQLFHVAMTKAAMDARADSEKALLKFRKLFRKDKVLAKKHDMKLVTAARAVLGAYGIGGKVNAVQALSDLEKVKEYDPEMYAQIEPVMRSALQGAGDYASLPYADFKAMLDAVNQIVHSAKRSKQVRIDGQLISKKEVTAALRARMEEIGIPAARPGDTSAVSDADRRKWTLQGLVSAARRVEAWVDSMDGGEFDGPFRKYIFQPISNAVTKYRTEKNRVLREYVALLREKQAEFNQAKVAAPEINYTFANKNELLGALLHIGNMSNKRKLLLGRGWATETVTPAGEKVLNTGRMDAFLDRMIKEGTLTKSDFDFLQKVWDLMESIKGDAQKAHYDMYGHYFSEITADPVVTPFGTYRGGYAPAVADKEIVQDAAMKNEANVIEEGFNYMMPSTATGFTKGRVEYNKPLVMDLRLVASHIDQALRFTYVQPAVRDALRIIRSSSFAGSMQRMDPTVITEMLMPWLHRSARQLATSPWTGWGGKAADKFLKGLRKRTGMVAMTANLVNAFQQITGFTMAAVKVNPRHLKSSLFRYMKAPNDTAEAIAALSPWMAERLSAESFELRRAMDEMLEDETAWQKTKEIANRHAYFAQRAFQNVVDIVSWQAAFDQASATMTEKEAVQFADSVVRQTQGTQSPEDIARFEASNSFVQLFTQFTGYFNMQANLLGTEYKKTMRDMGGDKGRLAYVYAMGFMLPAVIADGIVRTFGWDWDDEDDDGYLDEIFSWLLGSQLRTGVAMFPFVGSVANAGVNAMNKQPFDDRLSTSPSVSTIESSVRAPVSVYKALAGEGRASKAIGDVLTLITMTTGIPVAAVSRPLKYAADAAQDKVEPANAADLVRGAVSGKGREEERKK